MEQNDCYTRASQRVVMVGARSYDGCATRCRSKPNLEGSANINLRSGDTARSLRNWLPSCPQPEQLELRITLDPERTSPPLSTPMMWEEVFTSRSPNGLYVLEILRSLMPRVDGSIPCSKLTTLGISCDSNSGTEPGWTDSPDWALWFEEAAMREHISHHLPDLFIPEEIYKIVRQRQRQRLSQGQDAEEAVPPRIDPPRDWYYISRRGRNHSTTRRDPSSSSPRRARILSGPKLVQWTGSTFEVVAWMKRYGVNFSSLR